MKFHHLFMAATLAALTSCSERNPQSSTETPIRVRTYFPAISHEGELLVSGTVSARQTAVISTKVMGNIEKIHIRQGDHVRQGQTLATINSGDLKAKEAQAQAMIAEARAAAHDAEKDHQRYQTLHTQKSVSDKELENVALRAASARARLQMARQGLNEVRAMLAYARIRAPFSGTVTQKMVDEGTIANPGMPLLAIEQSGELNVTAAIPESYITRVKPGDKVRVEVKAAGLTADGTVSELSPSAAMTGGQYAMKVSIPQVDRQKPAHRGLCRGQRQSGRAPLGSSGAGVGRPSGGALRPEAGRPHHRSRPCTALQRTESLICQLNTPLWNKEFLEEWPRHSSPPSSACSWYLRFFCWVCSAFTSSRARRSHR